MEDFSKWPLLAGVNSPADIKKMSMDTLVALAAEIRDYLSFRVEQNGGHLASNLGVVELTLSIHRVFDIPHDHLIFDVGHQSYVHKLLTGRKEQFDTLRKAGGISGFTKRSESPCDAFGAGHASTSVSAAIGMAEADALKGSDAYTVAVIGDGALTGGLAYEGLNNCRRSLRLILIINENEMSISPNTGRLSQHLSKLRSSKHYLKTKEATSYTLLHIPIVGRVIYKVLRVVKKRVKHLFYDENIFEHMGIRYKGPMDGNDLPHMIAMLEHAKRQECSIILHVKTKKGKGNAAAEADPRYYHGLPPAGKELPAPAFSEYFGKELCRLAEQDDRITAITAAMSTGTGLDGFREQFPRRFFDVGIAEGHAVTFAAGLAAEGARPVVAVYSTFLQRAYDSILHDAALQNLPVVLAVDRAGFNSGDGPTHHGVFDVSFLSGIPRVRIFAPVTAERLAVALSTALQYDEGVSAVRYPHEAENAAVKAAFFPTKEALSSPLGVKIYETGEHPVLTVVTHGRIVRVALSLAEKLLQEGISLRILLCEYLSPYEKLADEVAPLLKGAVLFYEEEVRKGGFGVTLADALTRKGALSLHPSAILAAENGFAAPLAHQCVWEAAGVDETALEAAARGLLQAETEQKKGETPC